MKSRTLRVLLAMAVVLSLVITPALSFAGEPEKAPHATGVAPAANSATPDAWEDDDLPNASNANQVSSIPWEGDGFYSQLNHTIDIANGGSYDPDWYYFDVTEDEIAIDEVRYLIEAVSYDQDVDLVVEVYADGVMVGDPVNGGIWGIDPAAAAANDDSFYSLNPAAEFFPNDAGRYWIRVRPYYSAMTGFNGHAGNYTFRIQKTLAERVAGADRYQTAIEVSKRGMPTSPVASRSDRTILLANAMNYPDALSGAALATANGYGGALLLTPQGSLPTAVRNEIIRTGAQNVYVLGGPNVVSNDVMSQVAAIHPTINVVRVSGTDRLKTSEAIGREAFSKLGPRRFAFVAYAFNYPDALAATPIAVRNSAPIFLTPTNAMPAATLDAMGDMGVTDIIIVGSTSVVSTAVYNQCVAFAGGDANHVLRISGANRYETAKEIALWSSDLKGPGARGNGLVGTNSLPSGLIALSVGSLGLASGENFPDALSGGVLCGYTGHPLLLTPRDEPTAYIYDVFEELPVGKSDFFTEAGEPPSSGVSLVFGSEAAVDAFPLVIFSWMLGY